MALIKCKECKHEISKQAKTCPNCGAKNNQSGFLLKFLLIVLFLFFVSNYLKIISESNRTNSISPTKQTSQEEFSNLTPEEREKKEVELAKIRAKQEEEELRAQGLKWNYSNSEDKMRRGQIHNAWVKSLNTVNFSFPYNGIQRATITLRKHPQYGKDVIFNIEKGQLLCNIDECKVSIKFDEGKPSIFSASGPSDHSTETIFIKNYSRFVSNLKKSKKLYIECSIYQEGNNIFEFDVSELKWN